MNKIDELKALMEKSTPGVVMNNPVHECIYTLNEKIPCPLLRYSFNNSNGENDGELFAVMRNLLPQLIAIAEAAKKVCWYDFSTSELDGDVILDMRHLQTVLEPLTKDADK